MPDSFRMPPRQLAMCRALLLLFTLHSSFFILKAQPATWREAYAQAMAQPEGKEAWRQAVADTLAKYQLTGGGWAKNEDWLNGQPHTGQRATIDNGATWKELRFLALAGGHEEAVARGTRLLLDHQYPNGGFPQFLPPKDDYSRHITFNDEAMVGALRLLRDMAEGRLPAPDSLRPLCAEAVERGVRCILRCQIRDREGRLTVWCQQHDEHTLLPAGARAYELPSYCAGGETVDILRFLMELPHPNDSIRTAVHSGMQWLQEHALHDKAYVRLTDSLGRSDRLLVDSLGAPPLWARFYDLENGQPLFSDRDGLPRTDLLQVGYERRNGYAWYSNAPASLWPLYERWKASQEEQAEIVNHSVSIQ